MDPILAVAESRNGELRKVALEAVTAARTAAGNGEVHAIVFGPPGLGGRAEALGRHGADVILVVEHPSFDRYNPEAFTTTVAARPRSGDYRAGYFPASAQGRDLAPRVAG